MHWGIIDKLLEKQIQIATKMEENDDVVQDDDDKMQGESIVSEFITQSSPRKKSHNQC